MKAQSKRWVDSSATTSCRDRTLARQKLVLFTILVASFSIVVALLQAFVPWGARFLLVAWSPLVADLCKMWSVGVAGLLALFVVDRSLRDVGFRGGKLRYYAVAPVIPLLYCLTIYIPVWMLGLGEFRGTRYLSAHIVTATLRLPLFVLFAAGEEIGWRGVLVPNCSNLWICCNCSCPRSDLGTMALA